MMNRIMSLIKVDISNTYGMSAIRYKLNRKSERWQVIFIPIILLSILPNYYLLVVGISKMYDVFLNMGQKSMYLLYGILITQFILFFTGLLYVLSKYYFSNDLNILIPLPLKPRDIITAKFVSIMIHEYLISLPIVLPFILNYGIKGKEGLIYWVYSLAILIFIPVIPLSIASIIVMVFMKFTNIKGKKDLVRIIGYFVMLVLIIALQLQIQSMVSNSLINEEDFLYKLITDSNLLVKRLGMVFPPSMWAALSLNNYMNLSGVLYGLLFIGVSLLAFAIMLLLSEGIFFGGLIGNLEVYTSQASGKVKASDFGKSYPAYLTLGLKEIKVLLRTPIYMFNSVGGVVIIPIMLLLSIFMEGTANTEQLNLLIGENSHVINLIGIGYITALGIINCVGCTTFSREGKNLWIHRTMPIRIKDQILGRVLASLFVQLIGIVVLLGCLAYMGFLDVQSIFWIAVLGLLGSIPMTEMGMIIDIYRPLLDWDNPQKPMKQNLNVLISMGIGSLYLLTIGYLVYKMMGVFNILLIYGILTLIFIISSYVLYNVLKGLIERQFKVLE